MLYKLSLSNIKKSFKDYAIYFITLILGVCIFYIFNSIDSQTAMLKVSEDTRNIIKMLLTFLSGTSVFVSCVLGFLIIYASRFLMKKRNKEFGIYLTLGMPKRKISFLLLLETFLIGVISLVIGLILGIFISQITSVFISGLFEANMDQFKFVYSKSATLKTIIYFGIIYFIVMIFNTITINRCKLIDLINASKKQEKIKLKNPLVSIILFILSVITLSVAYYMVTDGINYLIKHDAIILLIPISLGFIGTFLFFYSVSGLALKLISKFKSIYFQKLNSFTFKQISSKINTMVISISVICIMLFFTICILSSALTIKNYFNKAINDNAPTDFEVEIYKNENNSFYDFEDALKDEIILSKINDFTTINTYIEKDFTSEVSYGNYIYELKERYPYANFNETVPIIKESDYNKIAHVFNFKQISLNKNEYAIVSDYERELYDRTIKDKSIINIFGKNLKPKYNETIKGFYMISGNPCNMGFFVVDDSIVNEGNIYSKIFIGNYISDDKEEHINLNKKIFNILGNTSNMFVSKEEIKDSCTGLSAIVTFIGLYLGLIFLISSSAILALKQLSDTLDDKSKYVILRKIGTSEQMINKTLFRECLIFFITPLSLAIIHTIFGIKFATFILSSIGVTNLTKPIIITCLFIILIYGGYFIVTYLCSKNIIKEK